MYKGRERKSEEEGLTLAVGEELPVLAYVFPPLCRDCELVEDCVNRTNRLTVSTIYASDRINEIHFVFVGCVDTVHRTHIYAGGVFYVDTGLGNDERHAVPLERDSVFPAAKSEA